MSDRSDVACLVTTNSHQSINVITNSIMLAFMPTIRLHSSQNTEDKADRGEEEAAKEANGASAITSMSSKMESHYANLNTCVSCLAHAALVIGKQIKYQTKYAFKQPNRLRDL